MKGKYNILAIKNLISMVHNNGVCFLDIDIKGVSFVPFTIVCLHCPIKKKCQKLIKTYPYSGDYIDIVNYYKTKYAIKYLNKKISKKTLIEILL